MNRFRVAAARTRKTLKRTSESRPFRGVLWSVAAIASSLVLSFAILMIDWVVRRGPNWPLFWTSWMAFALFMVVTNLFVISRVEEGVPKPNTDVRYYARMHSDVQHEPSEFLMTYHRSAFPIELDYTYEYTMGAIESALPLLLTIAGFLVGAACVFLSILINQWVVGTLTLQSIEGVVSVVVLLAILYSVLDWLLFADWSMYRQSKAFWISLWTYVVDTLEPAEQVADVTEYSGDWDSFLPSDLIGVKVDYDDPKDIALLRSGAERTMKKHGLTDALPEKTTDLFDYLDSLALLIDLKEEVGETSSDLKKAMEESKELRDAVDAIRSTGVIRGCVSIEQLHQYRKLLDLMPVILLSTEALEEVRRIPELDTDTRTEIMGLAQERLDVLWKLPESPTPSSLKWTGLLYSVASLVVTWFLSL